MAKNNRNCNHSKTTDTQKTNQRPVSDHDAASEADSTTNPKIFSPMWIPLDQIDLTEAGRLRENDNLELVDEYAEVFRQHMQNAELVKDENQTKFPFPPCRAYRRPDKRWSLPAGRHRALAAQKAGLKRIWCIVYSDEKEAIWDGLGDNRKNGLRNSLGDRNKMILIALQQYPDKSHRLIAEHIGCSPSSVDQVARQLRKNTQLTSTRTGRDGKVYPAKKPGKPKKAEPTVDTEEKPEKEMEEANVLFATSSGSQESGAPAAPEQNLGENQQSADSFDDEAQGNIKTVDETVTNLTLSVVGQKVDEQKITFPQTSLSSLDHLLEALKAFLGDACVSDEQRVPMCMDFFRMIADSFKNYRPRSKFLRLLCTEMGRYGMPSPIEGDDSAP